MYYYAISELGDYRLVKTSKYIEKVSIYEAEIDRFIAELPTDLEARTLNNGHVFPGAITCATKNNTYKCTEANLPEELKQ